MAAEPRSGLTYRDLLRFPDDGLRREAVLRSGLLPGFALEVRDVLDAAAGA